MSHFTVMVLGNNPEDSLAPYQENNMDDCPEEFLEFEDTTEEYKEQYETENINLLENTSTGERISAYGEEFNKITKDFKESLEQRLFGSEFREKAIAWLKEKGWKEIEIPFKEYYETFDEFMEDYCSSQKTEVEGEMRYGYYHNPNSRWDWYVLGGRWKGMLKLKGDAKGVEGEPGVFGNSSRPGWVDRARKGDIDWKGMDMIEKAAAMDRYDKFEAMVKEGYKPDRVKHFSQWWENNAYPNERYPHKPQDEYQTKEDFLAEKWRRHCAEQTGIISFLGGKVIPNRQDYVNQQRRFSTFAVIDLDGQWHEAGKMGWWGIVDATEEQEEAFSNEFFERWIEPLDDDVVISIYDCHV